MDLWIRSQDKELLIPNPKLSLENIENEYWIIDLCDDTVLGTYKTKERALEVLNDINDIKFYKYMASLDIKSFATSIAKECSPKEQLALLEQMNTYEMPEE